MRFCLLESTDPYPIYFLLLGGNAPAGISFAMKNHKKMPDLFIIISYVGVILLVAAVLTAAFAAPYRGAVITASIVFAVGLIFLLNHIFTKMRNNADAVEKLAESIDDHAWICYDKAADEAHISGNFAGITGIDTVGSTIDSSDRKNLMSELISCPGDADNDVYMSAKPEVWFRLRTFDTPKYEYTVITDVSEYVTCKNIIKSLKYYDSDTGLLCREAFISKLRSVTSAEYGTIGLVTLLISGIDKVISFNGTDAADKVVAKTGAAVKRYENPHNIFAGRTATNEFSVLLTDIYDEGCKKYADKLLAAAEEALGAEGAGYARIYCGFAVFTSNAENYENDAGNMLASSAYAAYSAKSSASGTPVAFDNESYATSAFDFKKIQVFNTVIGENRIRYNFQPIVDAGTGDIFAYEALMRPEEISGIKLSPLETISIAEKQGMTAEIEKLTFSNTIAFLSENQDIFRSRKLFVNSIPNCLLPESDYHRIFDEYSGIFDKLVVEVTEGCQISQENIDLLRRRYKDKRAQIALDDYGTGYANESSLISIKPDYIKIDRSLLSGIDSDSSKQLLVGNMITFAKKHGIKVLAEGVETRGELESVITLGVDLIQGYYTSKPNAVLLLDIPSDIKNEILDINIKSVGYARKTFNLDTQEPVDAVALAVRGYTDINVRTSPVYIKGESTRAITMRINFEDGYSGTVNIKDVNFDGMDGPVMTLGKECEVMLSTEGNCYFSYEGIRVPETSRFILTGKGSLNIDAAGNNGVIIGGGCQQDFGKLLIDIDGDVNITSKGDSIVGIGGGVGGKDSSIEIVRGEISANLRGASVVGIGAISGNANIKIYDTKIGFESSGQSVVAVGSKNGVVSIECKTEITADCSGDNCCVIGTLENGSGLVSIQDGNYDLAIHAKNSVAIGAMGGKTDVTVNSGYFDLVCEGNTAVGIGDAFGSETINIVNGIFNIHTASGNEFPIGTKNGKTVIHSGNIFTDSIEEIRSVSPFGDPLEKRRIDTAQSFRRSIVYGGSEYTYSADPAPGEDHITVYLPVGYNLKSV